MGETSEDKPIKHICVGIVAHVDAGKTTLSEGILYLTGSIRKLGRVDNRDAFLDTYALERERGITIFSKQAMLELGDREVVLLDTPGHVDFSAEMERTLQVLDYAILVISGADGVQGHTETLWRLLRRYEIPTFVFVNKMDQNGTDRQALLHELKKRLDENCVDFNGEKEEWLENLAMCDEAVLEGYLETGEVAREAILRLIEERKVFPCYFGSALKLQGVEELLKGIETYTKVPEYKETFGAKVFKISRDDQGNRLTYMKITGGRLKVKESLPAGNGEAQEEKINQIRIYSGAKYEIVGEAEAGMVCAVTGPMTTYPGQGLGSEKQSEMPVLEPVLTYQVILPSECNSHEMLLKMRMLEEEEPQLHIVWNEKLGEIQAQVMGEVQIEILKSMIKERFGVDVEFGSGSIVYKETIAAEAEGVGHFEPLRHYAEVHLLLEPAERGSGLQFESDCSEDLLDRNWQRLILTHLEEKSHMGILTGSEITDMKITLIAGRAHLKHTEGGDFRQATYRAVRQGLMEAGCRLLEPYYTFRLEIPSEYTGRAMADLDKMQAQFEPPIPEGETTVICGSAPVVNMQNYQMEVVSYTRGRGRLSCALKGYELCHNEQEVVESIGYDPELDLDNPAGSVFCAHGAGFYVPWSQVKAYMHLESPLELKKRRQAQPEPEQKAKTGIKAGDAEQEAKPGIKAGDTEQKAKPGIKVGDAEMAANKETENRDAGPSGTGVGKAGAGLAGGFADDKELEAIFTRTYGVSKRETERRQGPRRVSFDKKNSEQSGKREEPAEEYLLVDGYNIIFAWEELRELAKVTIDGARQKLMDILCNYQGYRKCNLILVYDAYKVEGGIGQALKYHNIHVVYTKEAETADAYIEKLAHKIGRTNQVTVATSDGLEQLIIRGQGCRLMSAKDLKEEIEYVNHLIETEHLQPLRQEEIKGKNYLLNHADETLSEYLEDVRLGRKQI